MVAIRSHIVRRHPLEMVSQAPAQENSDTQNVCIRDGNVYRLYVRMWSGPKPFSGQRIVG